MTKAESFILKWLKDKTCPYSGISNGVDVCNTFFMDEFIRHTGASHKETFYGAPKCALAGRTLSKMRNNGLLQRKRIGLPEHVSGFPNWIYSYTMTPTGKSIAEKEATQ
jgi:hypothetical protein